MQQTEYRNIDLKHSQNLEIRNFIRKYNFGREVTFSIQVAIIATSNTPLNIIIADNILKNSNVFGATYRPHQDLYTNIYSIKTFVERKHKKHKIT